MDLERAIAALEPYGDMPDSDIPPGLAALALASLQHEGRDLSRYRNHLDKLEEDTKARHDALLKAGAVNDAETRLAALKHCLADQYGYEGDTDTPDHIDNADIVRVIDRRKGGDVALSVLYMDIALRLGWDAAGLDMPGRFCVRLSVGGSRLIFDPYARCDLLNAADMRRFIKMAKGPHAELSTDYYEPLARREILIRLQNIVKTRQIESEDYEAALRSVEALRALAPDEYRLCLDAGVLYARTDRPQPAEDALEVYINRAPHEKDRHEAALLLQQIRTHSET